MVQPRGGASVRFDQLDIWFDPADETDIHITADYRDFVHPVSGKPGLFLVVSSNPRSANFDPATFNMLRDVLRRHGKLHPEAPADESIDRRLDRRFDAIGGTPPPRDPERLTDDPWDANAVRYVLRMLPILGVKERWTRNLLMEHLRGQRRLDPERIARARDLAAQAGVECRPDPGDPDGPVHFFRTDPEVANWRYPTSKSDRRDMLAAERERQLRDKG